MIYRERGFVYTPISFDNLNKLQNIKLVGYFQSYLYFNYNKDIILG